MKHFTKSFLWVILSLICVVFGVFFRFAVRGFGYIGYAFFFLAALIVLQRFLSKTLWRIVLILVCIGLVYFIIVEIPIIKNARTDKDPEREYLIVLGAAVHGEKPSLSLENRLYGALEYLEQFPDSYAIVSGGQGAGEDIPEALCMYTWLVEKGIDPERIIMEDKATSTKENLEFSFDIIRDRGDEPNGNVAILSSSYHLYRAKSMARLAGVEAAGVAGKPDFTLLMVNYFIREAFGVTHLWIFGW